MSKSVQTTVNSNQSITDKALWSERLENLQPLIVPFSRQKTHKKQFDSLTTAIPEQLMTMVRQFLPETNPGDILLAVFVGYMSRISSMTCFDLGFIDAELTQEIGDLEGLFAVYIPCRLEIDLAQNFTEIIKAVTEQIEYAKSQQSNIAELATTDPILSSLPGLDEEKTLPVGIKRVSTLEDFQIAQPLGRELTLIIPDDGYSCCWQYNSEILERDSIERMGEHLTILLQSIVNNPQQSLAVQSLLPEAELQKILWEWNQFQVTYDRDICIQELFEAQVKRTPEAIAVTYRDRQLTYRQLNQRANQLAHYLRDLGVMPDTLVGFCVDRSLEMIIGLLGILKAGGAYVPLDPTYPTERLAYMVDDSKISVLLTQSQLIARLPEHQAEVVYLDSDWDKIALYPPENPTPKNTGEDLAYVIYTSGSTGKPKGVTIPHAALSCFAQTAVTEYEIKPSDRLLQFASINFDVAVEEIFTSLLAGSTLVLRTDDTIGDLKTFCQACQDLQLTVLNLPTAYWHGLVNELASGEVDLPDSVRLVIIGGEKVLPEFVKTWQQYVTNLGKSDRLQLINSYGPTETTVSATLYRIPNHTPIFGEVPIGRPFPHLQTYILDTHQQPVPIGIPGELHIGGDALAKGYLKRPELTAEKFILDFFSSESSARLYRTGDLVRYLPDGNIEYIGRIDKQVKIRGFRIELGEIETVITKHPKIEQAAVIDREDTPGDKRLIAYYVAEDKNLAISALRSFLAERLPNYMIPSAYVSLDSLPITPSGKIDRRALPAPDYNRSDLNETSVAPRNDMESKLVEIWRSVLKIDSVGVRDNFFDLGGHSLLAVSVLTQVEKNFGKNIPLATFLTAPTVEGLAEAIARDDSTSDSLLFEIRATGSQPPLFLINAMGTGMLAYKLLAKYLDPELPVYGIRAVGMDDNREPHNRIDQMARAYIREMRSVQPEGPYFIAGVCTGGTIAFEMASQLISQGLEVAFLGLLDSTARPILDIPEPEVEHGSFFDRYIKHNFVLRGLNNLLGVVTDPRLQLKDKLSFTGDMARQLYQKIVNKLESITYRGDERHLPYALRRARVFDAGVEALRHYTPKAYRGGKVILVRAKDNPEHIHYNDRLGWDEFVGRDLEVHEIPADQTTLLFEPHIRTLASTLNTCLHEARSGSQSGRFDLNRFADSFEVNNKIPTISSADNLKSWSCEDDSRCDRCLHHLFEQQVERSPDAVAVVFEDCQLTYGELNRQVNQLAHYLQDLGVEPDVLVGICVERSLYTVIGILAILKAGGAYVPLDPSYPSERIAYAVADSQIKVLLTSQQHLAELPENQAKVVCFDRDWQTIDCYDETNPASAVNPSNLAYVIYTSGTTGKPKGVLIEHRNVCRLFTATEAWYGFNQNDVWTIFHSYAFDFSVWELWGALLYGGKLVVVPYLVSRSPARFYQLLIDEKVTVLNQTPSAFTQLIQIEEQLDSDRQLSLRYVIFGGEALAIPSLKPWFQRHGDRSPQLVNMYGITETTVHVTYRPISLSDTDSHSSVIGSAISDLKIYLLDEHLQPVAQGDSGEMYVAGLGLARGYLNRPELTRERFIPNPLNPSERLYKTGDLGRYTDNGEIEYLGRIDNQVKIRGFRIELGEIEAVLAQHPTVRQSAVMVREDNPGDKRLVAYVVGTESVTPKNLREALKQQLPDYMIPAAFVRLEALPLTANGKVDRRALPAPESLICDRSAIVPPRNETEKKLVEIWQSVLGNDAISVIADFFELGGHSLLAVRLLSEIERIFETNVSLETFLMAPTIEGLADALERDESDDSGSLLFAIKTTGSKPPLFLINGMGTGMLAYKLLAKYLDPELPVYGIKARGMNDDRVPHNRIEQMASAYIQEMRSVQPEGSYFIAGVCTGGTIAFEMASQLTSQGLEVGFLGLIDSTARPRLTVDGSQISEGDDGSGSTQQTLFERYIKHHFALRGLYNWLGVLTDPRLELQDKLSFSADMLEQLSQKIKQKLEETIDRSNGQHSTHQLRRSRVYQAGLDALLNYTPPVYRGGKVVLIRATENPQHVHHNDRLGWDEFVTEELEIYDIPADQTTLLFEPHIRTLAARLNFCLKEACNHQ